MTIHFIFTYFRIVKKNDYGDQDDIMETRKESLLIKEFVKRQDLGYMTNEQLSLTTIAKYYQLRYFLSPTNLSLEYKNYDTVVYCPNPLFEMQIPSLQDYSTVKQINDKVYILLR